MDNYDEESYTEKLMKQFGTGKNKLDVDRNKFEQMYEAYRKDPFGSIRSQLAQIPADMKMPDGTSMAQKMKEAEADLKKRLAENNNSIEISDSVSAKKKK